MYSTHSFFFSFCMLCNIKVNIANITTVQHYMPQSLKVCWFYCFRDFCFMFSYHYFPYFFFIIHCLNMGKKIHFALRMICWIYFISFYYVLQKIWNMNVCEKQKKGQWNSNTLRDNVEVRRECYSHYNQPFLLSLMCSSYYHLYRIWHFN